MSKRGGRPKSWVAPGAKRRCAYCRIPFREPGVVATVDHVVPQAQGGRAYTHGKPNLVWCCSGCNTAKADTVGLIFLHVLDLVAQAEPVPVGFQPILDALHRRRGGAPFAAAVIRRRLWCRNDGHQVKVVVDASTV